MNETQKKELVYAIFRSKKDPLEKPIVSKFVNNIANYTTVSELERGIVKERTIDRFIVK